MVDNAGGMEAELPYEGFGKSHRETLNGHTTPIAVDAATNKLTNSSMI